MDQRLIESRVRESHRDGKIPCAKALKLAEELGVSPGEVGKAANTLGIKIKACQLGCFK